MANQIPIKVMCDGSGNTCGLAQFTSSDNVAVAAGGTGLTTQGICAFAQPGIQAVACKTTYIGICAGKSEGAADENTYVGYAAGQNVTTGCYHTIIGSNAGDAITTCSSSTLIGYNAGTAITFGDRNTAVGTSAGQAITTATDNTLVGYISGCVTTGISNTTLGACTLAVNTVGVDNVAIGMSAGKAQVAAGCNNTFVGSQAGEAVLCRDNTLMGAYAGTAATTGGGNVMIGSCVGYVVVGGASNVYIGDKAGLANTSGNANVFIGNCAGCASTASCCLIIGNGACDLITGVFNTGIVSLVSCVGIGTTAPAATVHVQTSAVSGYTPTTSGDDFVVEGNTNTGISIASPTNLSGFVNFGSPAGNEEGNIRYYHCAATYVDSMAFATKGSESVYIDCAGQVTIGKTPTPASGYSLHLYKGSGNAYAYIQTAGTNALASLLVANDAQAYFYGVSADDKLQWGAGTDPTYACMTMDSSGNFGIGTATFPTDQAGYSTIQMGPQSALLFQPISTAAANSETIISNNVYLSGGSWKHVFADEASYIYQNSGNIRFYTAACAAAGASFNGGTRMLIDSSGQLGIGTTAPSTMLYVRGSSNILLTVDGQDQAAGERTKIGILDGDGNPVYISAVQDTTSNMVFEAGGSDIMTLKHTGAVVIPGSLSKGSGSFRIEHPLESKKDTHRLVHSFIEGPQADLIYRGVTQLVDGSAEINIDTESGMTDGTFVEINRCVQVFTTNETNWDLIKGSVTGNILTIESNTTDSTACISWMVVGERCDEHMMDTDWTDDDGKVIVEPIRHEEPEEPEEQ